MRTRTVSAINHALLLNGQSRRMSGFTRYCRSALVRAVVLLGILMLVFLPMRAHAQQSITLGIYPFLSSTEIYKRYNPLAEYLSSKLGRPVTIHLESSYDSHVHLVGNGGVDIAFLGPASYVKLTGKYGKVPLLAAFESDNSRTFKGVIIVKQDSPIKKLSQLKGKKFAFGDINSTMSHLVPRYMMLQAGIDVKDLGAYEFMSNHENVALGVLSGSYDAGAIKESIYSQYAQQGLAILATSQPLPDHLFVARKGLPADLVRTISKIMLSLKDSEEGKKVLVSMQKNLTALIPVQDKEYDPVRKILDALKKAGVSP